MTRIPFPVMVYFASWVIALSASLIWILCHRDTFPLLGKAYRTFLFEGWKVLSFICATALVALAAPYSGDPTWDFFDSLLISALTFLLAPGTVGILYRSLAAHRLNAAFWVAGCLFFVPCWAYDLYILIRDKIYPSTWASNLVLSGGICFIAGLFWNLCYVEGSGVTFAFRQGSWPAVFPTPLARVIWPSFFLSLPVIAAIGWFVYMFFCE